MSGQQCVKPIPVMQNEAKKEPLPKGRRSRKVKVQASKKFNPCRYDQKKFHDILEALIDLYPEMEDLRVTREGIVFSFEIDINKFLEKAGKVNPSQRV